jgi:hypothetical protein
MHEGYNEICNVDDTYQQEVTQAFGAGRSLACEEYKGGDNFVRDQHDENNGENECCYIAGHP